MAGTPGLFGVYLAPADWSPATQSGAISDWETLLSRDTQCFRVYYTPGTIPTGITSALSSLKAAGIKAIISLKPNYNPVSSSQRTAIGTFLSSCKTAGLEADVAIWHEPYAQGLTASQYIAAVQYYGPTIRTYYPMSFSQNLYPIASGHITASTFYPGDAWVDMVTVDTYGPDWDLSHTALASAAAVADGASPPKPFGVWEFNGNTADQSQSDLTAMFNNMTSLMSGRLSAGKNNADVLVFNHADGTSNVSIINTGGDYRLPLLRTMFDAITGSPAPPSAGGGGSATPGILVPGSATPGFAVGLVDPGPSVSGLWTGSQGIGNGSGIPDPPSMPLAVPVDNTGDPDNGLVAFLSWTLPPDYLGADMAVTDDAHNVWFPLGAPAASSPATGLTRCAIWCAPAAQVAGNVYMSPCGLPSPVYPAVMGMTILEVANMSPYLGTPAVVTNSANAATTISANCALPSATAFMFAVAASDTTTAPSGPGAGWTTLTGVSASGGGFHLKTAPAWQVSNASQTATWTTGGASDLSAASAVILQVNPAPNQPNPNWPAFSFQAGFGAGALTPPGQINWTDITSRWLAGADTEATTGKPYELDQLQAAEITATFDDNDGALTPDNDQSPFFPGVVADVPMRLLAWWQGLTYCLTYGFSERWPVSWDDTWYGLTEATLTDVWSLQQNQLSGVLREEITWDPNLYAYWPCSDAVGSAYAQNLAPGNTNVLQVVESKNGALTAVQSFGNDGGALPGDSSGTFWQQGGLTSGAEGYGYALYCADGGYPALSNGITIIGWFNPTGAGTQITNTPQTLILFRASNAGLTVPAFQVTLESPVGAHPGAIRMSVWDSSSLAETTTNVDTGDWLTAGFFHIALTVTTSAWTVYVNGESSGSGSANLPPVMSWLEFMGSADREYTGSMFNGECGGLALFSTSLTADRIQAIYLAGTPNPQTVAGGASQVVTGAQFEGDFPATRMERLLAYGGWTGPRSISQTSVTAMSPITDIQGDSAVISASGQVTVSADGQQAAQAINNIVFSDAGFLFTDGNGVLCYRSRGDLYVTQSQWTLGENVASGEIPYLPSAVLGYDKSLLYNGAELTPSSSNSGAPIVATNTSSIAQHGEYVYNATAYQDDPDQIADEANWIVNTRGDVTLRAEQLTADANANPDVWPFFLGVQPAQPATVNRRPQEATYTVTVFPIISQLTKSLDFEAGSATVKVGTDMFPEGTVLTAGDPVLGLADGTHILGW